MSTRTYPETVEYLFGRLPMYQRTGQLTGKLDLSVTLALLAALGDPQLRLRAVHIGGTNGKGTVSHTVAALLTAAGLRTGLYTSPHYVDYRERVRVDGAMVPAEFVVEFVAAHEPLLERTGASFFEFTVALAFSYFAEVGVDVAVVEVGLGGRLDSTNVLREPLVTTVTNIDLDHTEILGDTRALIAAEKAGIFKPGRPAVVGRYQDETWPVFRGFAERLNAPLRLARDLVGVDEGPEAFVVRYDEHTEVLPKRGLSVRGPFAAENLRTALATYRVLAPQLGLPPPYWGALSALDRLSGYGGRFVTLSQNPLVVADAGHNAAAWAQLVPEVIAMGRGGALRVVCGFVRGKRPADFLGLWPAGTRFYLGALDLPRNRPTEETAAEVAALGLDLRTFGSIAEAYERARNEAAHGDLVFVGGSSFVVGALLAHLADGRASAT